MKTILASLVTAVLVTGAAGALAAETSTAPVHGLREEPPALLAFTGATVVVAPGQVVEGATLVVREGRVVEVTKDLPPPAGALVRDLSGKRVYPGFVDPYGEYGLSAVGPLNPPKVGETPRYEGRGVGAGSWNDAVHAHRLWAEAFVPEPEAAARYLEQGVTAVQSAKLDGVFRGRGFVASLGEGRPEELLIRPYALQLAAFDKGSSQQEYPSSLMGSIALVRQTLLDARWYAAAEAAWRRNPAQAAPEPNRDLEALARYTGAEGEADAGDDAEDAGGAAALLFASEDELSLLRAGRISRELAVPFVHLGSNREYRRLAEVAALGQPIVLPLDFPQPPPVRTADDEVDVTLAELRHWERAPSNPAELARRGVPFAFTSYGLGPGQELLRQVRKAVRRGLDPETALAALTTVPAGLLGVESEVGSLAPGRRADFLVAGGDLLAGEGARIEEVWTAGRRAWERQEVEFRGEYRLTLAGEVYELSVSGRGRWLSGELRRGEAVAELEQVRSEDRRLHFQVDMTALDASSSGLPGQAEFTLVEERGVLSGRASLPDGRLVPVTVERLATGAGGGRAREGGRGGPWDDDDGVLISRLTYPTTAFGLEAPPEPEEVLVRGATVWTSAEAGVLEGADLLVRGGKIAAVGRGLAAPPGVRVIDATGKHVTPGIIDEHSHLAISGGVNEGSHAVTAEVRIGDVVDPSDVGIYRALAGGVTAAQLLHGSANPIGGQAQVIKLRWGRGAEELKLATAPPTIKLALGENVKQSNWGDAVTVRYPQTRMGVKSLMEDAFRAARAYGEELERYRALSPAERARTVPPRRDLQLEALLEVLRGERFTHVHSYVQSEMLMLMRLAEELGFTVQTFTHVLEGYKVAPEMAAHGAGASSFSDWWAYKFEVYDAIPYNTCLLTRAGVVTSVNSDSDEMIRRLNQEAGKSVTYCGMEQAEALKMVTLNPAKQLRIDDRVGSLEPGKDADFVIWNGPPLSVYSRPEETWIDGARTFSLADDARLRQADAAEVQALVAKAFRAGPPRDGGRGGGGWERRVWHCDDVEDFWRVGHDR